MSELLGPEYRPTEALRDALLDSRQRWRDLVVISADIAFETDADGRFTFLSPDSLMGWHVNELLGQRADVLLAEGDEASFNPFQSERHIRSHRVWLRRADGNLSWMSFSAAPLCDASGALTGHRGVARDITDFERTEAAMARALRRSELVDHIVWHMRTEIMAPRMMLRALQALIGTLGAHGAMVVDGADAAGPLAPADAAPDLLYEVGGDVADLRALANAKLFEGSAGPMTLLAPGGHLGMLCATPTRFEGRPGVIAWRNPGHRSWTEDDLALLAAAAGTLRIVLEHGAVQREMAKQARTDALTGLHNRRAFNEELARRLDRLDREGTPGTLMFVDVDNFKTLNDHRGHEAGDDALRLVADMLRTATRPGDLVARLGGDEFAIWMDGMDDLAAAERADRLCAIAPASLAVVCDEPPPASLSVGIVCRWPNSGVDGSTLLRRADRAMYLVKAAGRGTWRVWHSEDNDEF